jgi:FAD dependent oxidoreductase
VICGGGIIGASIAYFLSKRGVNATIIERGDVACAASGTRNKSEQYRLIIKLSQHDRLVDSTPLSALHLHFCPFLRRPYARQGRRIPRVGLERRPAGRAGKAQLPPASEAGPGAGRGADRVRKQADLTTPAVDGADFVRQKTDRPYHTSWTGRLTDQWTDMHFCGAGCLSLVAGGISGQAGARAQGLWQRAMVRPTAGGLCRGARCPGCADWSV